MPCAYVRRVTSGSCTRRRSGTRPGKNPPVQTGLAERVAIVTGAGSGIGLATTRAFVAEGARVIAADLDPAAAVDGSPEGRVIGVTVDLATPDGPTAAVDTAIEQFGRVDVLVNNVGIAPPRDGFLSVSDADWAALMDVNFMSMVRACRAAIPHMLERGAGSIVSISSDAGYVPAPFFVDYSITKAAIRVLSKALANEFADRGIRSNTISPGPIRTAPWERRGLIDALAERWGIDREAAIERFIKEERRMPLGRLGEPEDVAALVVFLASDLGKQITGSDYRVDGGMIATI